jgi:hypothetical protein
MIKCLSGLIAIVAYWPLGLMGLLQHLANYPRGSPQWTAGAVLAFVMSAPFVLLCIGAIEAVTGRPFRHISPRWNAMSEGKQGLFAFVLLCLGIGFVGLLLYLAVRYFSP